MTLTNGSRLGPYEIVSRAGAGGMGEVYRARDTRLDRTVAVKILPVELASDARLLARFEREARAISALNHPNICSVHDVGRENGISYMVMEYCDGKTLDKVIDGEALPTRDVLRHGIEIADALDSVHRQGITHRDLKPSNIIITKSGAKLLDFGLAKQHTEALPEDSTLHQVTEEGKIVGTIQYMAPELFHGKEADARSDLFSLGAILYEMLTGKRAFSGGSKASLIASILSNEPPSTATEHPLLDHVIRQCLEKEPEARWQTAHDVAAELRWIRDTVEIVPATKSRSGAHSLVGIQAAVVLGIVAFVAWYTIVREHAPVRTERFHLQPPPGVRVGLSGAQCVLAISPDGRWVAFVGTSDDQSRNGLYLRSIEDVDARLVAPRADSPFFSPDSKWLGFLADGKIQKILVTGGEPQAIAAVSNLRGVTWGQDGTLLFSAGDGLLRVSANGGKPTVVTVPRPGERHIWPQFLPGDQQALFTIHAGVSDSWRKIAVLSLKNSEVKPVLSGGTDPRYLRNGYLVYSRFAALYAAKFDRAKSRITSEPKLMLDGLHYSRGSGFTAFDVGESGSLVYIPGAPHVTNNELIWVDRQGRTTPVIETRMPYEGMSLSADGRWIAINIFSSREDSDLWLYDLERSAWTRLTLGQHPSGLIVWAPDGKSIIFTSFRSGHGKLCRIRADGFGSPEQLTTGVDWEYAGAVSPQGDVLLFMRNHIVGQWDLLTLSLDHPGVPTPFFATPTSEAMPRMSPDGHWVVYESRESGSRQIHVRPFSGAGPSVRVSNDGGWSPYWSRNGREIFYIKTREIWSVAVLTNSGFKAGSPHLLFKAPFMSDIVWADSFSESPDGKRFLMVRRPPEEAPERRLVYVPNWANEVKQRDQARGFVSSMPR